MKPDFRFRFLLQINKSFLVSLFKILQQCKKLKLSLSRLFAILTLAGQLHALMTELLRQIWYSILFLRLLHVELEIRLVNDAASLCSSKKCYGLEFDLKNLLPRFLLKSKSLLFAKL